MHDLHMFVVWVLYDLHDLHMFRRAGSERSAGYGICPRVIVIGSTNLVRTSGKNEACVRNTGIIYAYVGTAVLHEIGAPGSCSSPHHTQHSFTSTRSRSTSLQGVRVNWRHHRRRGGVVAVR